MSKRRSAGFTLIELLVVLAIIGLLLSVTVPRYFHVIDASKEKILVENLRVSRDAIDKFYGDTGRYPDNLDELVDRKYLRALPYDPLTESSTSWVIVAPDDQFTGNVYDIKSAASGEDNEGRAYGDL